MVVFSTSMFNLSWLSLAIPTEQDSDQSILITHFYFCMTEEISGEGDSLIPWCNFNWEIFSTLSNLRSMDYVHQFKTYLNLLKVELLKRNFTFMAEEAVWVCDVREEVVVHPLRSFPTMMMLKWWNGYCDTMMQRLFLYLPCAVTCKYGMGRICIIATQWILSLASFASTPSSPSECFCLVHSWYSSLACFQEKINHWTVCFIFIASGKSLVIWERVIFFPFFFNFWNTLKESQEGRGERERNDWATVGKFLLSLQCKTKYLCQEFHNSQTYFLSIGAAPDEAILGVCPTYKSLSSC